MHDIVVEENVDFFHNETEYRTSICGVMIDAPEGYIGAIEFVFQINSSGGSCAEMRFCLNPETETPAEAIASIDNLLDALQAAKEILIENS